MTEIKVFTNAAVPQSLSWCSQTVLLPWSREGKGTYRRLRVALRNASIILRWVRNDCIVFFGNTNLLSSSIASILLRRRRVSPFLARFDPLLPPPKGLRAMWVRMFTNALDILLVHTPSVAQRYHAAYRIPLEKMRPIRYHHTLTGFEYEVKFGDYVFAGGDSIRDYDSLIRAVEGLSIPVVIATRNKFESTAPPNVRIGPVSDAEFRKLMAGARLFVLPLDMTHLRTAGQQSFLSAMALGKLVIVTDTVDATYYIEHMKTGILTPTKDVRALREAIIWAWEHPVECEEIGKRAKEFALPMDQEWCYSRILELLKSEYRHR